MKEAAESNSGKNMSQRNPTGRFKGDRACNDYSSTIHLCDSTMEDRNVANGKKLSEETIPGTTDSNVFNLESNSRTKVSQS